MPLCIPGKDSLFCDKCWRFFSLFEANTNPFGQDCPRTPFVVVLASQGRTVRKIKDTDLQPFPLCSPHEIMLASKVKGQRHLKKRGRENLLDQIKHIYCKQCLKNVFLFVKIMNAGSQTLSIDHADC